MNTPHGYHIDGTFPHISEEVEECGGPNNCTDCNSISLDYQIKRLGHAVEAAATSRV